MNTTSIAQYAAEAAKSSCRFASVIKLIMKPNSSVKSTKMHIATIGDALPPTSVTSYIATIGIMIKTEMIVVMIRLISTFTRDREKSNKRVESFINARRSAVEKIL